MRLPTTSRLLAPHPPLPPSKSSLPRLTPLLSFSSPKPLRTSRRLSRRPARVKAPRAPSRPRSLLCREPRASSPSLLRCCVELFLHVCYTSTLRSSSLPTAAPVTGHAPVSSMASHAHRQHMTQPDGSAVGFCHFCSHTGHTPYSRCFSPALRMGSGGGGAIRECIDEASGFFDAAKTLNGDVGE